MHWLSMKVKDGVSINEGLGHAVGRSMGFFYAGNGLIGSWEPEWQQGSLNVIIGLFHEIGLKANINKPKTFICHPGTI